MNLFKKSFLDNDALGNVMRRRNELCFRFRIMVSQTEPRVHTHTHIPKYTYTLTHIPSMIHTYSHTHWSGLSGLCPNGLLQHLHSYVHALRQPMPRRNEWCLGLRVMVSQTLPRTHRNTHTHAHTHTHTHNIIHTYTRIHL